LKEWDDVKLDWALRNILKDQEEEAEKIKTAIEILKPWLNIRLYKAEQENQSKKHILSDSFKQELIRRGANISEIEQIENASQSKTVSIDLLEEEIEREIDGRG
jgi:hypothetical protein